MMIDFVLITSNCFENVNKATFQLNILTKSKFDVYFLIEQCLILNVQHEITPNTRWQDCMCCKISLSFNPGHLILQTF